MSAHTTARPLGGIEGYRRLARLLVRTFYSGEVPPPEAEAEETGDVGPRAKAKPPKVRV
jgi:hypothetical protein